MQPIKLCIELCPECQKKLIEALREQDIHTYHMMTDEELPRHTFALPSKEVSPND